MLRIETAFLVVLLIGTPAQAQAPPLRFQWTKDQFQTYRVKKTTAVTETTRAGKDEKPATGEVRETLDLTKRWTVRNVDAAGTAMLELTITQMRQEMLQPDGKNTVIDSTIPADAKQMGEYLNKPVLTLKVDARGQVLDVSEVKPGGSTGRILAELPFRVILPTSGPSAGQTWAHEFVIKLDPPHGTGETYEAVQTYTAKGVKDGLTIIGIGTALKAPPKTANERIPLVPMLWTGEVFINTAAGRFHAARLTAKAEFAGFDGDGSKFVYEGTYAEDAVEK